MESVHWGMNAFFIYIRSMQKVTIYFNTECSKCNSALDILNGAHCEIEIKEYLKNPPTKAEIKEVLFKLNCSVQDIIRKKEPLFIENFSDKHLSEEEWINVLIENPILIERPIIISGNKAIIGRPPERVIELLNS
jgi:arsenate reductase